MKKFMMVVVLGMSLVSAAEAKQLLCASKKDQQLYYTNGQVRVTAEIVSDTKLKEISLSTTGDNKLGFAHGKATGNTRGEYTRFDIGGDAWCSYRMALPEDFADARKSPAYVDAYCEENTNDSIRLNCVIR